MFSYHISFSVETSRFNREKESFEPLLSDGVISDKKNAHLISSALSVITLIPRASKMKQNTAITLVISPVTNTPALFEIYKNFVLLEECMPSKINTVA